jgi:hypothetical protein
MKSEIKIGVKLCVFVFAIALYYVGVVEFHKVKELIGIAIIVGLALPTVFRK